MNPERRLGLLDQLVQVGIKRSGDDASGKLRRVRQGGRGGVRHDHRRARKGGLQFLPEPGQGIPVAVGDIHPPEPPILRVGEPDEPKIVHLPLAGLPLHSAEEIRPEGAAQKADPADLDGAVLEKVDPGPGADGIPVRLHPLAEVMAVELVVPHHVQDRDRSGQGVKILIQFPGFSGDVPGEDKDISLEVRLPEGLEAEFRMEVRGVLDFHGVSPIPVDECVDSTSYPKVFSFDLSVWSISGQSESQENRSRNDTE